MPLQQPGQDVGSHLHELAMQRCPCAQLPSAQTLLHPSLSPQALPKQLGTQLPAPHVLGTPPPPQVSAAEQPPQSITLPQRLRSCPHRPAQSAVSFGVQAPPSPPPPVASEPPPVPPSSPREAEMGTLSVPHPAVPSALSAASTGATRRQRASRNAMRGFAQRKVCSFLQSDTLGSVFSSTAAGNNQPPPASRRLMPAPTLGAQGHGAAVFAATSPLGAPLIDRTSSSRLTRWRTSFRGRSRCPPIRASVKVSA